METPLASTLV